MQIPLILLIISLSGIAIMIARKIIIQKNKEEENKKEIKLEFDVPDLDQVKTFANKKIKKYGYITLVSIIKLYIIGGNIIKKKGNYILQKIKTKIFKNKKGLLNENKIKKESSLFLKTISEYKNKIKRIKHKIKEEEGIK